MNSDQFLRYLAKHGATINRKAGKGGHVEVKLGDKIAFVPTHGGAKQLGKGLMQAVKKQLGIKD